MTRPTFSHRPDARDLGELRRATANLPGAVCSTPPALSNTGGTMQATGARAGTPFTNHNRARGFSDPAAIKEVPDMAKKPAPAPSLAIRSCVPAERDWTADPANLRTVLLTGITVALAVIAIALGTVWVAAKLAGWAG